MTDNVDIALLCQRVAEQTSPLAKLLDVSFHLEGANEMQIVQGNAAELQRMLYQLISNAMKFTEKGGEITLQMKTTPETVYLTVSDNGGGVPDHILSSVFHRFEEVHSLTDISTGLGLGLSYVWQVATACGGSVMLTSKKGVGTRVTVSLPNPKRQNGEFRTPISDGPEGLSTALIELSDALPVSAFSPRDVE